MPGPKAIYLEPLLREIQETSAAGYEASLLELVTWIGCSYPTGRRLLSRLEMRGMVRVGNRNNAPRPLRIKPLGDYL